MVSYIRGRSRTLSDAVIVSRYLAGEDSTAIGADANCTADTVLYLVRRSGGTTRLSGPTIADRAGTTAATIYHRLRAHNVPRRPAGDTSKASSAAARARRLRKEPP
jgi:hypothetical protein